MHEIHDHIYFLNVQEVLDEEEKIFYEILIDQDDHRDYHEKIFHTMHEFHLMLNLLKNRFTCITNMRKQK